MKSHKIAIVDSFLIWWWRNHNFEGGHGELAWKSEPYSILFTAMIFFIIIVAFSQASHCGSLLFAFKYVFFWALERVHRPFLAFWMLFINFFLLRVYFWLLSSNQFFFLCSKWRLSSFVFVGWKAMIKFYGLKIFIWIGWLRCQRILRLRVLWKNFCGRSALEKLDLSGDLWMINSIQ